MFGSVGVEETSYILSEAATVETKTISRVVGCRITWVVVEPDAGMVCASRKGTPSDAAPFGE